MKDFSYQIFFFEQIKMKYIAQKQSDSPRTRCAKSDESLNVCYITTTPSNPPEKRK